MSQQRRRRDLRVLRDVVVVGASLAGYRTAQALRAEGYAGRIHLVGAEPHLPYERPPLSKGYLARTYPEEDIWLATLQELDALDLSLVLGSGAIGLDTDARRIELADGSVLGYDALVVATGASPRLVAGLTETSRPETVRTLRTIEDARLLSDLLGPTEGMEPAHLAVIGGGFIGSEVASTGLSLGARVTVIDSCPTPMHSVLHDEVGSALATRQRNAGVQLRLGCAVREIMVSPNVRDGGSTEIRMEDGDRLTADLIVVGVGVTPNTAWLEGSGVPTEDGVVCDEGLRSAPGIWAAGDVTRWSALDDGPQRLEHWTSTNAQAAYVAKSIFAGASIEPFRNVPYFWSDQFGVRLEVLGEPPPDCELHIVWGSVAASTFVGVYRRCGSVVGAMAMNAVRPFLRVRRAAMEAEDWRAAIHRLSW